MYNMSDISELITSTSWFFQYGPKIREGSAASSKTAADAGVRKEKDCAVSGKVTSTSYHPVESNAVDCLIGHLLQELKFWYRCTEAVLECVRNLQQRLDNDKAHLLHQLEQMCSEDQVRQVAFGLVFDFLQTGECCGGGVSGAIPTKSSVWAASQWNAWLPHHLPPPSQSAEA